MREHLRDARCNPMAFGLEHMASISHLMSELTKMSQRELRDSIQWTDIIISELKLRTEFEEDIIMENRIKINFCLAELKAQRAKLARIQLKEYQTRGNTQRCQELWSQITKLDEEIARRESK